MITEETICKVQAYVDGELPETDLEAVNTLIEGDPELTDLLKELRSSQEWLRGNEMERKLPESRDFYWSKILRGIEAEEAATIVPAGQPRRGIAFWLRWLLPVGGLATVLFLAIMSEFQSGTGQERSGERAASYHEVDHPSDTGSLITFRSNAEGVTVVWLASE